MRNQADKISAMTDTKLEKTTQDPFLDYLFLWYLKRTPEHFHLFVTNSIFKIHFLSKRVIVCSCVCV